MHIDIISNIIINLKKHIYQPEVHFFLFINQPSIPMYILYIMCTYCERMPVTAYTFS